MPTTHLSLLHIWTAMPGLFLGQTTGAGFNLWATFRGAEVFGQTIVILLMFFSLLAWTVMIGKYLDLSHWRKINLAFQARLKETENLMGQSVSSNLRQGGPYARLFLDAVEAGRQYLSNRDAKVRMGLIENALQRAVGAECVRYETKMVLLGSLVSGAPFIGLLGTVSGVMVAFNGMGAAHGGATLDKIAPGVASALLATVAGLFVAIPSMFGYNILLTQVKVMITELENYASWLADRIELEMETGREPSPQSFPTLISGPKPSAPSSAPIAAGPPAPADPGAAAAERYLRFDVSDQE